MASQISAEELILRINIYLYCSCYNKRQFVTTNTNTFTNRAPQINSNPGIISEVTKRQHHAMDL